MAGGAVAHELRTVYRAVLILAKQRTTFTTVKTRTDYELVYTSSDQKVP